MERRVIFGPPGTGKTTTLLSLMAEELKTVAPDQIAFVSFTRKGTYEGVARAQKEFNFKEKELKYYKTLHAICFSELGALKTDMVNKQHYRTLSKVLGISFTGYYTEDFSSNNDEYLHAMSMEKHNPRLAARILNRLNDRKYLYIKFQYEQMKQQLCLRDFDDLLLEYLDKCEPLNVKVAFIDEGQDLTPLQWDVALKMFSNVERIYVAGDDDQAVYEWAGADVRRFLRFSRNHRVLNKSHRLPNRILKLATGITKDIAERKSKFFEANGQSGIIDYHGSLSDVKLKPGDLVLARTNYILKGLTKVAAEEGRPYLYKGRPSIDKLTLDAVQAYIAYAENQAPIESTTRFQSMFTDIMKSKPWTETIKLEPHEIAYYERLIKTGYVKHTPIKFETFHSSKGSEADHVIICPDITKRIQEEMSAMRDSELRCLYVGMTRALQKLTILSPTKKEKYPNKYFA